MIEYMHILYFQPQLLPLDQASPYIVESILEIVYSEAFQRLSWVSSRYRETMLVKIKYITIHTRHHIPTPVTLTLNIVMPAIKVVYTVVPKNTLNDNK